MSIPVEVFDEGLTEHLAKQWEIDDRAESFYVDTEYGEQTAINSDVDGYIQELPVSMTKRYLTITNAYNEVEDRLGICAEAELYHHLCALYDAGLLKL